MTTPARSFLRNTAAASLLAFLLLTGPAGAQPTVSWLCRVRFQEQTYGGDTLATTGVAEFTRAAPQADGSVYYMGWGNADIVFTPGGPGCSATSGGRHTHRIMAIVSSEDGQSATVDITVPDLGTFPVVVQCGPQRSEMDVFVSVPPSVTLPLQDGASASYDESTRHSFGQIGGARGTVTLEYCRPS
jgi:hypothetical protein